MNEFFPIFQSFECRSMMLRIVLPSGVFKSFVGQIIFCMAYRSSLRCRCKVLSYKTFAIRHMHNPLQGITDSNRVSMRSTAWMDYVRIFIFRIWLFSVIFAEYHFWFCIQGCSILSIKITSYRRLSYILFLQYCSVYKVTQLYCMVCFCMTFYILNSNFNHFMKNMVKIVGYAIHV